MSAQKGSSGSSVLIRHQESGMTARPIHRVNLERPTPFSPDTHLLVDRPSLAALTTVRFFAAFWVLLFHTRESALDQLPAPMLQAISHGDVGVSLFFVLSGFILAYNYALPNGGLRDSRRQFWVARFARIYPTYLVGLAAALPALVERIGPSIASAQLSVKDVGVLVLTPTLLQAWLPQTVSGWNVAAWTLSVEAFFYALFPLLLASLRKPMDKWRVIGMVAGLELFILLPIVVHTIAVGIRIGTMPTIQEVQEGNRWILLSSLPIMRLPEFIMGIVMCKVYFQHGHLFIGRRWIGSIAALAGLALPLMAAVTSWPFVFRGGFAPVFGVLILALASRRGSDWLAWPPLVVLGQASYALYLIHYPIWGMMRRLVSQSDRIDRGSVAFWVLYCLVVIGFSVITLILIEEPARRLIRARLRR